MKRLIIFFTLGIFSSLFVIFSSASSGAAQPVPNRVEDVYRATVVETEVPLVVPALIPTSAQTVPTEYWASSIAPNNESYSISFDRAENCTGVEECSFAIASGKIRDTNDPTLESMLERTSITGAERVALENETDAVYVPAREGIYMPSYIHWDVDNYRYSVGIYMGKKSEVLEMANSVVQINSL